MKKTFIGALACASLLFIAGCNKGGGEKIGFSVSTLNNPFFVTMAEAAKAQADQLGLNITIVDAGNDAAKQVMDIDDLISMGVKVMIINPVDSAAVAPAAQDVRDAGIKIIAVDRSIEGVPADTFIGTDNVAAASLAAAFIAEKFAGKNVAILEGVPGTSASIDRLEGFRQGADDALKIVTVQTANFDRAQGLSVTEDILQANPDVAVIMAANDEMALGAIEAVSAAGKKPGADIIITGFDATDDARAAISAGTLYLTVEQKPALMGEYSVQTAQKFIKGESAPDVIPVEAGLVMLDVE